MVALHKSHGVLKLREGSEGRKVIKMLIMWVIATAVRITYNWATVKKGPFDHGSRRVCMKTISNWGLRRWRLRGSCAWEREDFPGLEVRALFGGGGGGGGGGWLGSGRGCGGE